MSMIIGGVWNVIKAPKKMHEYSESEMNMIGRIIVTSKAARHGRSSFFWAAPLRPQSSHTAGGRRSQTRHLW